MSVTVQHSGNGLEFGSPAALFKVPGTSVDVIFCDFDVAPIGQRILALPPSGEAEAPPLNVMLNWQKELAGAMK
jgi:hypothetical protein